MELVKQASDHHPQVAVSQVVRSPNLEEQYHGLQFDMQRCAFYHGMRARFFDVVGKAISLLSLVAGAGAFTTLLQGNNVGIAILASITAFFSGLNLIVGFSRKGRDHEVLRAKYYGLMVELDKARYDEEKMREIGWRMKGYFADGTIFMSALDAIAHNRTCLAFASDSKIMAIPKLHVRLAHLWSFTGYYAQHTKTCDPKSQKIQTQDEELREV